MTQQNLRGKKYSGDVYARKWGTTDTFIKMGNITELTTTQETEKDELKSTGRDDYGQAIEVETSPQPIEISLKFNTFDKHALARTLMGEAVDIAGQVQAISETTINANHGLIKLSHEDINPDDFVLKQGSKAIDKTKYRLNHRIGMLEITDWTGIDVGAELKYSGNTKGRNAYTIDANTLQSIPLEIYLDGKDRITGNDGTLVIPHVVLSADGDVNWFNDEWWESGLTGTVVKDANKPAMRFTEYV